MNGPLKEIKVDARVEFALWQKVREYALLHDRSVSWVVRTALLNLLLPKE